MPPPPPPPLHIIRKRRKKVVFARNEPLFPDSFLTQENFLSELGLCTPEVYKKACEESRRTRTERRRRTTANPKYSVKKDFVDPNDLGLGVRES